jgi:prepilin signal peptidase PulO-like enzyme (type II secretory pathway)
VTSAVRRPNWPLRWVVIALVAVFAAYAVVGPLLAVQPSRKHYHRYGNVDTWLSRVEGMKIHALECVTIFWLFFFGASIGSFLNVVAWRMPRGLSITVSQSRCPECGTKIRPSDNVPIFGWLRLRGTCRDCGRAIDSRYLWVEILTGGIFVALAASELLTGGENLPIRVPNYLKGVMWVIFDPQWDLLGWYTFHTYCVTALFCASLMQREGFRLPRRYVLHTLSIVLAAACVWPRLNLIPWHVTPTTVAAWNADPPPFPYQPPDWLPAWPWLHRLATPLVGLVVGASAGMLLALLHRRGSLRRDKRSAGSTIALEPWRTLPNAAKPWSGWTYGLALVGTALGWQAAVFIGLWCALFVLSGALWSRWRPLGKAAAPLLPMTTVVLVYIGIWRVLAALPRAGSFWGDLALAVGLVVFAAVLVQGAARFELRQANTVPGPASPEPIEAAQHALSGLPTEEGEPTARP